MQPRQQEVLKSKVNIQLDPSQNVDYRQSEAPSRFVELPSSTVLMQQEHAINPVMQREAGLAYQQTVTTQ